MDNPRYKADRIIRPYCVKVGTNELVTGRFPVIRNVECTPDTPRGMVVWVEEDPHPDACRFSVVVVPANKLFVANGGARFVGMADCREAGGMVAVYAYDDAEDPRRTQ